MYGESRATCNTLPTLREHRGMLRRVAGGFVRVICPQWPRADLSAVIPVVPSVHCVDGDDVADVRLASRVSLRDVDGDGTITREGVDEVHIHVFEVTAMRPDVDITVDERLRLDAAARVAASL